MVERFAVLYAGVAVALAGCADVDDSNSAECVLGGESCQAFSFYKVTEDRPIFEEPGPNGYMLLVRAEVSDSDGAYFEYAEQGRKAESVAGLVMLDDPRSGEGRPYPPLTQLLVPESHPRGVAGSPHWYGWGEVERRVDFESRRVALEFGPMTFLNQTTGEEWRFESGTSIEVELDVLCWTAEQEPADLDSEFCREELPRSLESGVSSL